MHNARSTSDFSHASTHAAIAFVASRTARIPSSAARKSFNFARAASSYKTTCEADRPFSPLDPTTREMARSASGAARKSLRAIPVASIPHPRIIETATCRARIADALVKGRHTQRRNKRRPGPLTHRSSDAKSVPAEPPAVFSSTSSPESAAASMATCVECAHRAKCSRAPASVVCRDSTRPCGTKSASISAARKYATTVPHAPIPHSRAGWHAVSRISLMASGKPVLSVLKYPSASASSSASFALVDLNVRC